MGVSTGHVVTGSLLTLAGGGALLAGLLRSPAVPASILDMSGPTFTLVMGGVFLLGGAIAFAFARPRDEGPAPSIPAHVAFTSRTQAPASPELAKAPPRPVVASRARQPAPLPPDVLALENRIKDVTREINKAGVMFATGKLSREGYTQYVEDLKKQRSALEAERMTLEMRKSGA